MKLEMARLEIIGLKSQLMPTLQTIHELGCIQIEDLSEVADVSARPLQLDRKTVQKREDLTYLVARLEGLISKLSAVITQAPDPGVEHSSGADLFSAAQAGVDKLIPQVQELVNRREKLEAEQASLPRYETTLRKLLPIVPEAAHAPENIFIGVLVGQAHIWVLDAVADEILKLSAGRAEMVEEDIDKDTRAMLIVVPREFAGEVEQLLGREDISRLRLPDEISDQPPDTALLTIRERLASIPQELTEINAGLASLADTWLSRLRWWRSVMRDQLDEIDILSNLGETEQTFVLVGWLPERDIPHVQKALEAKANGEVIALPISISEADRKRAPVALVNPPPARPFQSLVRLYSLPRYEGIDPTILMAVFLPLFFGMILGDVGYGLVLLLLCFVGLRLSPEPGVRRDIIQVLALGSGWSILFGLLYGEAFGSFGEEMGMHALWFERASAEHVTSLLILSIAAGVVHITLGLVLGVWEAIRDRSRHLLLERGGMLVGLIGLFLITSVLVDWLPEGFMRPAAIVMVLGIVLLSVPLGWIGILLGPIEFVGLIGNILSYLRIAAIGLASVYLARLANDIAGLMGSIVVGVIIALLIHALNLVLGAFSPTIHSLRLHYVEFFRKFYEGGGHPFEPFQKRHKQEAEIFQPQS